MFWQKQLLGRRERRPGNGVLGRSVQRSVSTVRLTALSLRKTWNLSSTMQVQTKPSTTRERIQPPAIAVTVVVVL